MSVSLFVQIVKNLGLLRLAETRLAETTIGRRPIGRKPQLADVTISRNHDWPKAQIGRKRAGGPPLARARYGPPAHFRPILSIFCSNLFLLSVCYIPLQFYTL